jgi:hypothetical protein
MRRSREEDIRKEDIRNRGQQSVATMMRNEIIEMQKTVHVLQMRVKELTEQNDRLKEENANIHNN